MCESVYVSVCVCVCKLWHTYGSQITISATQASPSTIWDWRLGSEGFHIPPTAFAVLQDAKELCLQNQSQNTICPPMQCDKQLSIHIYIEKAFLIQGCLSMSKCCLCVAAGNYSLLHHSILLMMSMVLNESVMEKAHLWYCHIFQHCHREGSSVCTHSRL